MPPIKRRLLVALCILTVAVLGLLSYTVSGGGPPDSTADDLPPARADGPEGGTQTSSGSPAPATGSPKTPEILVGSSFDPADKAKLVAVSNNVFVGAVESVTGDEPTSTSSPSAQPQVQYEVRVLDTLKATGPRPLSTGAKTTVNQLGGTDPTTGETHVVRASHGTQEWIDTPLQPGSRYLFSTWYDPAAGWHSITLPRAGAEPLDTATSQDTLKLFRAAVGAEPAADPPA